MASYLRFAPPLVAGVLSLATLILPTAAHADALPANSCDVGKKAGDACEFGSPAVAGTCHARTCTSGRPEPDGGHTSTQYDCLLCESGGGSDAGDEAGVDGGGNMGAGSASSPDDGGCSASGRARAAGPWVLALGVALAVGATRRRTTSKHR